MLNSFNGKEISFSLQHTNIIKKFLHWKKKKKIKKAVKIMYSEYKENQKLTEFKTLESEPFYEVK